MFSEGSWLVSSEREKSKRRRLLLPRDWVALAPAAVLMLASISAMAVSVITIRGTIANPVGRPIVGAAITDGRQTVYSDTEGRYALEENSVRDYQLTVTREGLKGGADIKCVRLD